MREHIWSLYLITNKVNGKVYVGQAAEVAKRWYDHRKAVRMNKPTQIVHHAMIKYGLDNFVFEIIACCRSQEDANYTETELVKQYDSFTGNGKGYNATLGGMNAPKTEEWKRKVSEKLMGHEVSQETRDKVSKGNTGKVRSEEFKKGVSDFHKGKIVSEETKEKLSNINKGNTNFKGKQHSEEAKQKISKANKGRKPSEAALKKAKEAFTGKTWKLIDGKRVWIENKPSY